MPVMLVVVEKGNGTDKACKVRFLQTKQLLPNFTPVRRVSRQKATCSVDGEGASVIQGV